MLKRCILAENRKLHASPIWAMFFVLPILSATYGTFNYLQNLEILTDGWYSLWTQHTLFYSMFFFPAMAATYAAYLWRLEHLGHNWNLIMASPVPPLDLFAAKFITVPYIHYNDNLINRLFFRLSLWAMVLWISRWLIAFVFQHNIVRLDVPVHVRPSVVGVCDGINNRVDKLHFRIVRIVLFRHVGGNGNLYHASLCTAFQVIGSFFDFRRYRAVLILNTHLSS